MKRITIYYPDDCTELNACLYAQACFTPCQHDYKKERDYGRQNCEEITFGDDRVGAFWITKEGYFLGLNEKEGQDAKKEKRLV